VLPTLVLTAGLGTRLDPLTRLVAKPAVPLGGRTIIERILEHLWHHGIRDVVLNLHHRAETITRVVGDGAHLGLRVRYSWEQPALGSAGGPRLALPLLEAETFFIVNGDTLSDVPLAPLVGSHKRSRAMATLAVVPNPAPDRYNGIVLDHEHTVFGFVPKGRAHGSWHFVGVQVVQATTFEMLEAGVPAETVAGIYRDMAAHMPGSLHGLPIPARFIDVGTPRDYLSAAFTVTRAAESGAVIERGARVDPTARLVRSVVWPEAQIDAGVQLESCIVAGAVRIPSGFRAESATLVPASVARDGDDVRIVDDVAVFPFDRAGDSGR
jgi:NDP-sugar pyrophosphorylase family protein